MKANIDLETALSRAKGTLKDKIIYSVELLRKAEKLAQAYDPENGYYLAFSGGKDSQALYHIAELAGVKFKAHMSLTSVDPPEVIRFVKEQYPEVELIKPKDSIYNIAVKKVFLPTMTIRWCCTEFKENAGAGKVTLIGIRHAESTRRSKRNEVEISKRNFSGTLEQLDEYREKKSAKKTKKSKGVNITNARGERTLGCISGKESLIISPIIHWTEQDVWNFLNDIIQVPHCRLYDKGFKRIGCILCPMSQLRQKKKEEKLYPHVKRNWLKTIKEIRKRGGYNKTNIYSGITPTARELWHSVGFSDSSSSDGLNEERENEIAENIYDWWISGKAYKKMVCREVPATEIRF